MELNEAIKEDDLDTVRSLLQSRVNPNVLVSAGVTPLLTAINRQDKAIINELLKSNADPNFNPGNSLYSMPLDIAMDKLQPKQQDTHIMELLLKANANPNIGAKYINMTPLHIASAKGNVNATKLLLESGANPSEQDVTGNTPLHYFVKKPDYIRNQNQDIAVVNALLKSGADVSIKNKLNKTPIELAQGQVKDALVREATFRERKNYLSLDKMFKNFTST
jgi:ankyrin repeat protein